MAIQTEATDILVYGVDFKNRRIYFGALEFDPESSTAVTSTSIEFAVRALQKLSSDGPNKPVEIYMSSYGGDPYAMLYLYDAIQASSCQIKFFGGGAIMSAATWIMAACDERYLYPNATIMIHNGSSTIEDRITDAEVKMEEEKRLQSLLEEIYAHNSRMPKSFWSEVCKRDLYLDAEEAILLGLADKIVAPQKRGSFRKIRQANLNQKIHHGTLKKLIGKIYSRIQFPVQLKDINLNAPITEEVDETLIIEETKSEEPKQDENKKEIP